MKGTTKAERAQIKARKRSQQNTEARKRTTADQRRRERRKALRLAQPPALPVSEDLGKKTVAELRDLCSERGIKTTTKTRKSELIEALSRG